MVLPALHGAVPGRVQPRQLQAFPVDRLAKRQRNVLRISTLCFCDALIAFFCVGSVYCICVSVYIYPG